MMEFTSYMDLYGYADQVGEQEPSLLRLSEVTLSVSSGAELKALASFLLDCADRMEAPDWEHEHFCDSPFCGDGAPDVIVFKKS